MQLYLSVNTTAMSDEPRTSSVLSSPSLDRENIPLLASELASRLSKLPPELDWNAIHQKAYCDESNMFKSP